MTGADSRVIWVRRASLICAVAVTYLVAVGNIGLNSDLFLGFAAGKRILSEGMAVPCHWSFTNSAGLWVDQNWLSHLLYYIVYSHFEESGPVLIKALLLFFCSAFLYYRCRRLGAGIDVALFSLFAGLFAASPFLTIRAENFGIFYLLILVSLLSDTFWSDRIRLYGVPVVIGIWSNFHGSFMLGLALVIAKACLVSLRAGLGILPSSCLRSRESLVAQWWFVAFASIAMSAFFNPYGITNLVMPFTQVGTGIVTSNSSDWLSLLNFTDAGVRIVGTGSQFPYLSLLMLVVFAMLVVWTGFRKEQRDSQTGETAHTESRVFDESRIHAVNREFSIHKELATIPCDLIMEAMVLLVLLVLSLKHRRFILFAAMAFVPAVSVLVTLSIQSLAITAKERFGDLTASRIFRTGSITAVALALISSCWLFVVTVVLPYSPHNPLRPPRSLLRDFMSYDTFSSRLVSFIEKNRLEGRTLAGWEISSYLLFYTPKLQLFMDTRDQSFFPPQIIKDYFIIMGVAQESREEPEGLLDKYGVSYIVLTTYPYDFNLGMSLLKTGRWGCIFSDDYSLVLVRRTDILYRRALDSSDYDGIWYPDEETRIRSEAMQSHFEAQHVPPRLGEKLKQLVHARPWPNYYRLICWAFDNPQSCLKRETEEYLKSEILRLMSKNAHYRHGAEEITTSLIALAGILEENAYLCGHQEEQKKMSALKISFQQEYDSLNQLYRGYLQYSTGTNN
ncbi:hypothetical protein [Desulfomonile tiedjei]|uniref:Glycosyltransferase RgtA/B/C/D-like domain-containing protein n=1 Tax=Desulfomonile tiedjei (strain ATCC 49306 / DSM 6799 / DCB-1) TaxID=706587 RepID=I4CDQ0_DESTA|nr:hypothetical protein [Desulfomonile tiedjei]AFM27691.1 hypothetical protein Desti_5081 [Desulfomonile tiedjei DSM 6799]